jgi:hypothetical protein
MKFNLHKWDVRVRPGLKLIDSLSVDQQTLDKQVEFSVLSRVVMWRSAG